MRRRNNDRHFLWIFGFAVGFIFACLVPIKAVCFLAVTVAVVVCLCRCK